MRKVCFNGMVIPPCPSNYNGGQCVEWTVSFVKTGKPGYANNKPAQEGGDVGEWQVKSPKATLTERDKCEGYIFGFSNTDYFYEMSCEEFEKFVEEFSYEDRDSRTKAVKRRIKNDSKKMREWLERRA